MSRKFAARTAAAALVFLLYRSFSYLVGTVIVPSAASFAPPISAALSAALCLALLRSAALSPDEEKTESGRSGEITAYKSGVASSRVKLRKNASAVCASLAVLLGAEAVLSLIIPAKASPLSVIDAVLSVTVYPISEEFLFRGAMMRLLLPPGETVNSRSAAFAVMIQASLFASSHPLLSVPTALLAGIVFGILTLRSRSDGDEAAGILPVAAAISHAIYNGAACLSQTISACPPSLVPTTGAAFFGAAFLLLRTRKGRRGGAG